MFFYYRLFGLIANIALIANIVIIVAVLSLFQATLTLSGIAGIVLTGGGSQLRHLKQLVEYITGMDTRIGYPNEHLAGDTDKMTASPQYSTAVGLVMNAIEKQESKLVHGALNFDDIVIRSVMTPRTKMFTLNSKMLLFEALFRKNHVVLQDEDILFLPLVFYRILV